MPSSALSSWRRSSLATLLFIVFGADDLRDQPRPATCGPARRLIVACIRLAPWVVAMILSRRRLVIGALGLLSVAPLLVGRRARPAVWWAASASDGARFSTAGEPALADDTPWTRSTVSRVGDADAPPARHPRGLASPASSSGIGLRAPVRTPSGTWTSANPFSRAGSLAEMSPNSALAGMDRRRGGIGGAFGGSAK